MGGPDLILSPHPGGLSCRGPSRPRLCPELRPQCWSRSYRDLGLLLQVSVICMLSVYLKLTDCLRPPSMRSLELLSYPAYYMPSRISAGDEGTSGGLAGEGDLPQDIPLAARGHLPSLLRSAPQCLHYNDNVSISCTNHPK